MGYDGTLKFDTSVNTSGFQSGINKISSIAGGALKTTGAIIAGAGTAIVGLGTAAIKVGADFEAGMSKVQAISNASAEEMVKLTDKAKEMGAKTKFSAGESAEAFQYMAMAGWKTEDMLAGIEGVMNLAAASGEDLATTSDIVTDALTAFGMSAADSGRFADVLAAASSNANTNVSMMGETFKYVAPVAGALGFSAEDCATAIGLMANSGIKASQAGTSLRSIFTRMAKPTTDVQAAMDQLGISITNSDGSMKSLNTIMQDLRKGFSGLTEEQKTQMAATIGGQEAMSGLLAIVNASDEDFEKLSESIYNSEGAAERMAETMMDNLPGAIEQASGALETLGLTFYEKVQDPAKETIQTVTEMIDEMNEAFTENGFEGLVQSFGDNLAELSQMAMEAVPSLVDAALTMVQSFISSIVDNKEEFVQAGVAMATSIVNAVVEFAGDFWSAGVELLTEFIAGMAEKAPQIVENAKESLVKFVSTVAENLPSVLQSGITIILELAKGIAEAAVELAPVAVECILQLVQTLSENLPQISQAAFEIITTLAAGLVEALPELIASVLEALPTIITNIVEFMVSNQQNIVQAAITLLNGLVEAIPQIVVTITENLPQIIQAIVDGFTMAAPLILEASITLLMAVIEAIPQIVVALIENLPQIITTIITCLLQAIPQILATAVQLFGQLIAAIPQVIAGLVTGVGQIILSIVTTLGSGIASIAGKAAEIGAWIVNGIINWVCQLPGKIAGFLSNILSNLITWGSNMVSNARTAASNVLTNVSNFFGQLPGKIGSFLTNALNNARTWGSNLVSNMKQTALNAVNGVVSFISQLPGKVMSKLSSIASSVASWGSNLVSSFSNIGRNVIQGLINGIGGMVSSLYSSIKNALGGLVDKAKSALGIHSPSKVFAEEIGEWIPPGVGVGIEDSMPDLEKQTDKEMEALADRMQAAVNVETGKITLDKNTSQTYKVEQENGQSFVESKTEVVIEGETHVHVDLDEKEIGHATTPIVDKDMGRIDTHKKRGG